MKTQPKQIDLRKRRLKLLNHFFLFTAVMFVVYQNVLRPAPPPVEAPIAAQAIQFQPQTPPPGIDPEDAASDEIDLSVRPEERLYSPRLERVAPIRE